PRGEPIGPPLSARRVVPATHLFVPETIKGVVIDHADGLHHRVTDRRTDELKTALDQILAQVIGLRRVRGGVFNRAPGILLRLAAYELPRYASKLPNSFCT